MHNINLPRDVTPDAQRTLRQIKQALEALNVPLLTKFSDVKSINPGTSAYYESDGNLYRYTKIGRKLHKELIEVQDIPEIAKGIVDEEAPKIAQDTIDKQPDIEDMQVFEGHPNEAQTIRRQYQNADPPFQNFALKWYFETQDVEMTEDQRPADVTFNPTTPVQTQVKSIVEITFTPVVKGLHIADLQLVNLT